MKLKITGKLMTYFAMTLVLFALVLGLLFALMFRDFSAQVYQDSLTTRAEQIADSLSAFGRGRDRPAGGMNNTMRLLSEAADTDMWLVDRTARTVTAGRRTKPVEYSQLPMDADKLLGEVFDGRIAHSRAFSGMLEQPTITVAAPIKDTNGQVVMALLLHGTAEGTDAATREGLKLLLISGLIALALSSGAAALLSHHFIKPIKAMQVAANHLAEGDYAVQVAASRRDELGALAQDLNSLSRSLMSSLEQSKAEEERRRHFMAKVSHELRTPVTVLQSTLEALTDGVITDKEEVKRHQEGLLKESLHLKRMVQDLLDLSRMQSPGYAFQTDQVNLSALVTDVARTAKALGEDKDLVIEATFAQVPALTGDATRLRQLMLILVDNAVRVSPRQGQLRIDLELHEQGAVFTIQDQGPGIPETLLPHLFDAFRTGENVGVHPQGTGLGLAIAKEIAERHGAVLTGQNAQEGGAVFSLQFPS
ncbi:MAG: HAMP domain-containing protein [Clostridiales bacterium]|nr:HAMP domain-containing protein [Clostridiales bacterium]